MSETYEIERNEQWIEVQKLFETAIQKLDEFNKKWCDWSFTDPVGKGEILKKMLLQQDFKLNVFTYSDRYYDRCGGSGGSSSYFVTPLSEEEIREQMREFYEKNSSNFCCHRFLQSMYDKGIYLEDSIGCYGGIMNNEVDFYKITEKDILSAQRYVEIVTARETAEKAKREKDQKDREERDKEIRRKQFEALKKEFE